MQRMESLDVIKILAALCVMNLHIIDIPKTTSTEIIYYASGCAIPLLFMTNGYLLLNKKKKGFKDQLNKAFRVARIIVAWSILYWVYGLSVGISWWTPFNNVINSFLQKDPLSHFWFIWSLLILQILYPLLHKIFRNRKNALVMVAIGIIICFIVDLLNIIAVLNKKPIIETYVIQSLRLWTHLTYFLLGGLLGKKGLLPAIKEDIPLYKHSIITILLVFISIFYQQSMSSIGFSSYAEVFYDNIIVMSANICLFSLLLRISINNEKICYFLREVSINTFGGYIIHMTVLFRVGQLMKWTNRPYYLWLLALLFLSGQLLSYLLRKSKYTKWLVVY